MSEELVGLIALSEALVSGSGEQRLSVELLEVSGADAASFLQGQLSADLGPLDLGGSCWSLLLEPDGRLGELLRVLRLTEDRFVLLGGAGRQVEIAQRLERFRFRVKVALEPRSGVLRLLPGSELAGALAPWLAGIDEVLGREEDPAGGDARLLDGLALLRGRVGPADLRAGMNPFELGAELVESAVSFKKGCYTGQELVARIDARSGAAPHRLWTLRSEQRLEPGPIEVGGEELGELLRSISDPSQAGSWGSARMVRRLEPVGPVLCRVGGLEAVIEPS